MFLNDKLVSIACRIYNAEGNIAKTIESILNQTYENWELVIVDDNSQDHSQQIIKSYTDKRIKYYRNDSNIGIISNLNKVLSLCKGDYISILDGDDYYYPDKLEKQVKFLNDNPDYGAVFSYLDILCDKKNKHKKIILEKLINRPSETREAMLREIFEKENFLAFPTEMFRRELIMNFPGSIIALGDCNFHVHVLLNSKIKVLEKPFVKYSIFGNNNSSGWINNDVITCENIYLLKTFSNISDLELFKSIFKGRYEEYGEPTEIRDIPYFTARIAMDIPHRFFSGLYLLQTIFEDNDYLLYIMNKFNLAYKDYIKLRCLASNQDTSKKIFGLTYFKKKVRKDITKITYCYVFRKKIYKNKIEYSLLGIKLKTITLKE